VDVGDVESRFGLADGDGGEEGEECPAKETAHDRGIISRRWPRVTSFAGGTVTIRFSYID
jgi:hypothetical protein